MRKIQTHDVFKLAKIIRISGARAELEALLNSSTNKKAEAKGLGIKMIMILVNACGDSDVEKLLYELIGDITNKDADVIKTMDFNEFVSLVKQIAAENDLSNFFNTAVESA